MIHFYSKDTKGYGKMITDKSNPKGTNSFSQKCARSVVGLERKRKIRIPNLHGLYLPETP
jgi:hypothetical protein